MRLLIDTALAPRLARLLSAHVRDYGMQDAADEDIIQLAFEENRIIVSADSDFGTLLAAQEAAKPSFVLFRDPDIISAEDFFGALQRSLPILEAELHAGVAVFRAGRIRIRKLPIRPS